MTVTPTSPSCRHVAHRHRAAAGAELDRVVDRGCAARGAGGRGRPSAGAGAPSSRASTPRARASVAQRARPRAASSCRSSGARQQLEPALVDAGENEQVVDGAAHAVDLLARALEHRARRGRQVVVAQADVELGAHRRQRRAQLVRGVGDQPALLLDAALDAVEHRVERGGEVRDLVARGAARRCARRAGRGRSPPPSRSCGRRAQRPAREPPAARARSASSAAGRAISSSTRTRCTERSTVASDCGRDERPARCPRGRSRARRAGSARGRAPSATVRMRSSPRSTAAAAAGASIGARRRPGRRSDTITRPRRSRICAAARSPVSTRARDVDGTRARPRAIAVARSAQRAGRRSRSTAAVRSERSRTTTKAPTARR